MRRPAPPRYREVADALLADIRQGRYPVGTTLPREWDLCDLFGVSRHTVREALRTLQTAGLISRRQGAGTVVIANDRQPGYAMTLGSLDELLRFLDETVVNVLKAEPVATDPAMAGTLGCPVGEPWLRVETFRQLVDRDKPLSWTEFYLPISCQSIIPRIGHSPGPVYRLVEEALGVTIREIRQDIEACRLPAELAGLLKTDPDLPALRVVHKMLDGGGRTIEVAVSLYPIDRFRYSTRMRLAER